MNALVPVCDINFKTGTVAVRDARTGGKLWLDVPTKLVGDLLCVEGQPVTETGGQTMVVIAGRSVWTAQSLAPVAA